MYIFIYSTCASTTNLPSDVFGLRDKVGEFAVSGVWQQHANNSSHDADCAKNNIWKDLTVNTWKKNKRHRERSFDCSKHFHTVEMYTMHSH